MRQPQRPEAQAALEVLCEQYWIPVYRLIRRRGYREDVAQDLTQGFFADLLERNPLSKADPTRGRFRAFLKTLVKHYLANQARHDAAQKRGGGVRGLSLDWSQGEAQAGLEPRDDETAESLFEREWALTVVRQTLEQLRSEYEEKGRGEWFDALRDVLVPEGQTPGYQVLGERLGLSVTAVKVSVFRLRERFRQRLRQVVTDTLDEGESVDDEIRQLLSALRGV